MIYVIVQNIKDLSKLGTKKYLNWQNDIKVGKCSDVPATGCSKVNNCLTVVCYTSSNVTTYGCRMCNKNFYGTSFDATNSTGSTTCVKGNSIANCDFIRQTGTSTWACYSCATNYAVAYSELACVSYGNDSNCRRLSSGNSTCYYCWHSYFWDSSVCKLKSNFIA